MKIQKYIEIVRTDNKPFSSMGLKSCSEIFKILEKHYQKVAISTVEDITDLELLVRKKPDLVFLGLKKLPSTWSLNNLENPEIWLSEFFDSHNIKYTGSDKSAIKLDYDKESSKEKLRSVNLPTADSFIASPKTTYKNSTIPLNYPLFIKPLSTGGGKGVGDDSVVRNFTQFKNKIETIYETCSSLSLVENYLTGREFSVAILENLDNSNLLLMPIEIITAANIHGDRVLGGKIKVEDNERVIGVEDFNISKDLCDLSEKIYKVLGGRDLGRIDFRQDHNGKIHFLEANFMPGPLTRYFASSCKINKNMSKDEVILRIVKLALNRKNKIRTIQDYGLSLTK